MREFIKSDFVSLRTRLQVLFAASFVLVLAYMSTHPLAFHFCQRTYLDGQGAICEDAYISSVALPLFIYAKWAYAGVIFGLIVRRTDAFIKWGKFVLVATIILLGFIFTTGQGPPPGAWIDLFPYYRLEAARDAGIFFSVVSIIYVVVSYVIAYIKVWGARSSRPVVIATFLEILVHAWAPLLVLASIILGFIGAGFNWFLLQWLIFAYAVGVCTYAFGLLQSLKIVDSDIEHNGSLRRRVAWRVAIGAASITCLILVLPFFAVAFSTSGNTAMLPYGAILLTGYLALYLCIEGVGLYRRTRLERSVQRAGDLSQLLLMSLLCFLIWLGLLLAAQQ